MEVWKRLAKQLIRPGRVLQRRKFSTSVINQNRLETANKNDADEHQEKTTHFGFKTIKESEKEKEGT